MSHNTAEAQHILSTKIAIAFEGAAAPQNAAAIYKKLSGVGKICDQPVRQHDGSYYMEINPYIIGDGLPVSEQFMAEIIKMNAHFCGSPYARHWNNIGHRVLAAG